MNFGPEEYDEEYFDEDDEDDGFYPDSDWEDDEDDRDNSDPLYEPDPDKPTYHPMIDGGTDSDDSDPDDEDDWDEEPFEPESIDYMLYGPRDRIAWGYQGDF